MGEPAALVERRDHIMLITLNRPEVRNAVNAELTRAVGEALDEADADASVRAVIVTGAGDKARDGRGRADGGGVARLAVLVRPSACLPRRRDVRAGPG
jgi:1,4-dihydroxy-2-naphthoyl-CoA synthase